MYGKLEQNSIRLTFLPESQISLIITTYNLVIPNSINKTFKQNNLPKKILSIFTEGIHSKHDYINEISNKFHQKSHKLLNNSFHEF